MKTNSLQSDKPSRRKRFWGCLALVGGLVLGTQLIEPTTVDAEYGYYGYRSPSRYNYCYGGYRRPVRYGGYRGGPGYGYRYSGNRYGYGSYYNSYRRPNYRYNNYRY